MLDNQLNSINFSRIVKSDSITNVVEAITLHLQKFGFGVLTTIDFAEKLKSKLDIEIPETIVLGACKPKLAYEVYQQTTDFLSIMPCNVVVRNIATKKYIVEIIKPSSMVQPLMNSAVSIMANSMDKEIQEILASFKSED